MNIKHLFFLSVLFVAIYLSCKAFANVSILQIVYPADNQKIYADSTFFIGNTKPDASLTINDEKVKVFPDGSFVHVFNLKKNENIISIKAQTDNFTDEKTIKLYVPDTENIIKTPSVFIPEERTIIVTEEEAPLRKAPYGDRLTPQKKNTVLYSVGEIDKHYKILLEKDKYAYILKNHATPTDYPKINTQYTDGILVSENGKNIIISVPMKQPVPVLIETNNNSMKIKLSGTQVCLENSLNKSALINNLSAAGDTLSFEINSSDFNGYDYYYEDNKFILKIRKPFEPSLKGKIITIDAGHGGNEKGSVGPTNIPEKDINLKIAHYLKKELEKSGAKVVMTREDDSYIDLYERVNIAKKADSDILISIHNNALPDGQNPYLVHGTSTYYYHPQAAKLAESIQNNLVNITEFKNLGVKYASFVLTRPSVPVSVLVEVGFMINPYEYSKLIDNKYQKQYAIGIKNGIEEYFK